jgi:hypothetical protein
MTTITITDPALLKQLADARGPVMLRDPAGNVLLTSGEFFGVPPEGFTPPFSEEEMVHMSQNREGRPLADILRDLREKHGS